LRHPFSNEPATDFRREENVQAFRAALELVRAQSSRTYPLVICGEKILTNETFQ
jgi:1-pyrroline-5-carboxylate dehydrogenase